MSQNIPFQVEEALARIVPRNIEALVARRHEERRQRSTPERIADGVTAFAGSMKFVVVHLFLFGGWIVMNLPGTPFPKFDPQLIVLAMFASVEAIFLSTFVLISQNRASATADRRADLALHVSLLTEHEVTRLVELTSAIAARLRLAEAENPELEELKKDIAPESVLQAIEAKETSA